MIKMLELETEDMLPRQAPLPAPIGIEENIIKPSVPEVSIVMNVENESASSKVNSNENPSYANWKKQCLPKVSYPSSISNGFISDVSTASSVYPMRSSMSKSQTQIQSNSDHHYSPMAAIHLNNASAMTACCPSYIFTNQHKQAFQPLKNISQFNKDILTICSSTQTNTDYGFELKDVATKQDIDLIMKTLHEIHMEQTRLSNLYQTLQNQLKSPSIFRDTATQCDGTGLIVGVIPQKRPPPIVFDYIEENSVENHNIYRNTNQNIQKNSSKSKQCCSTDIAKPAQSDAILPKPTTEKSIVMNELALKYLPNEKLTELLQELHVDDNNENREIVTNSVSAKRIDSEKDANDISNASYKYLKKYRLLPEERTEVGNFSPYNSNRQILNYPCTQNEHLSPLVLDQHSTTNQEDMIDLETIRRQPKFL